MMSFPSPRQVWFILGLACIGLVTVSLVLTVTLNLHACHLCIFQRLLFMLLTVLNLAAAFPATNWASDWAGVLSLPTATLGVRVAAYQSWLQRQPTNSFLV